MSQELYKTNVKCLECGDLLEFITWYGNGEGGYYYLCTNCNMTYHLNEEIIEMSDEQEKKQKKQQEYEKNEKRLKELKDKLKDAKQTEEFDYPYKFYPSSYGWICPVCGRGNAPTAHTCPCRPQTFEVTC